MSDRKFPLQNILTLLFLSISILYIGITLQIIRMIYIFNNVMIATHAPPFGIILLFPHFISLPILFSVASLTFFHLSLKIREGSKLSWFLAVLFLVALPYPLFRVSELNITPLIKQFQYSSLNSLFLFWNYIILILVGISSIILISSFKNFIFEGQSLPKKSKFFLSLFFFFIAFPTMIFSLFIYYQAHYHDNAFAKIKKIVTFHIYQPTYFPNGRGFETVYYIPRSSLIKNKPTVQVDLNYSIKEIMNGKKSGLISMKQSSIDKTFNYKKFVETFKRDVPTATKSFSLKPALSDSTILKEKKGGQYLLFMSKSNTLVVITAFYISRGELLQFADQLE